MRNEAGRRRRGSAIPGPEWVRNRLGGAFALLLLLVVGLVVASAFVARDLHEGVSVRLVHDAMPLRSAVYDLQARLLDEETGVRGFVITGREASLAQYRAGRAAAAADLAQLRPLAARHAGIAVLLDEVESWIVAVDAYFAQEIALVRRGEAGRRAAQAQVEAGTALFDSFRGAAERLVEATNALVDDAVDAQERRYRELLALLGALGGAAVLLVLGLALSVSRRTVALMRAERRARERSERLEATVAGLAAASTAHEVAGVIATQAREALAAQHALVCLLDERTGELRGAAGSGGPEGALDRLCAEGVGNGSRLGAAVHEGEPILLPSDPAAGGRATIAVPLVSGGRVLGGFFLGFDAARAFDEGEATLFRTLGRQCSQALERALLLEAEYASRARAERLDEVGAALSSAVTPADIVSACLDAGGAALGAQRGWLGLLDHAGHVLELAGQRGYADEVIAAWLELGAPVPAPAADVLRARAPLFLSSPDEIAARYPALAPAIDRAGDRSWAVLPVPGGSHGAGALLLAFDRALKLNAGDRRLAREIAERCARALERGREYELQRHAAETLQRGALPELLPDIEGLELAATYAAGAEALEVGGDWYDAFTVPGRGEVGLVVGDVVGKGVEAASTMARLRNALRAYAMDGAAPADVLARLDALWMRDPPTYATAVVGSLDLVSLRLRLAVAGHPPPLLVPAGAPARFLHDPRGTPLGASLVDGYRQFELELDPGDALLLYTDGLVESRDLPIDDGLERLRAAAEELRSSPVGELVRDLMTRCLAGRSQADDVVVLAVRVARVA